MIVITGNNEFVEKDWTREEFEASSLPLKGWTIYGGVWPLPISEPPVTIPQSISMRQTRLYLYDVDNGSTLSAVETYVLTMSPKAQIEWNTSAEVWRSSPMVEQMRVMFGWTIEQMDTMFIEASLL